MTKTPATDGQGGGPGCQSAVVTVVVRLEEESTVAGINSSVVLVTSKVGVCCVVIGWNVAAANRCMVDTTAGFTGTAAVDVSTGETMLETVTVARQSRVWWASALANYRDNHTAGAFEQFTLQSAQVVVQKAWQSRSGGRWQFLQLVLQIVSLEGNDGDCGQRLKQGGAAGVAASETRALFKV